MDARNHQRHCQQHDFIPTSQRQSNTTQQKSYRIIPNMCIRNPILGDESQKPSRTHAYSFQVPSHQSQTALALHGHTAPHRTGGGHKVSPPQHSALGSLSHSCPEGRKQRDWRGLPYRTVLRTGVSLVLPHRHQSHINMRLTHTHEQDGHPQGQKKVVQ